MVTSKVNWLSRLSAISKNENSRLATARSPTSFVSLVQGIFLRSTASMAPRRRDSNSKKVAEATSDMPSAENASGALARAGTLPSTSPLQGPPCRGEYDRRIRKRIPVMDKNSKNAKLMGDSMKSALVERLIDREDEIPQSIPSIPEDDRAGEGPSSELLHHLVEGASLEDCESILSQCLDDIKAKGDASWTEHNQGGITLLMAELAVFRELQHTNLDSEVEPALSLAIISRAHHPGTLRKDLFDKKAHISALRKRHSATYAKIKGVASDIRGIEETIARLEAEIAPPHEGLELGIGDASLIKALSEAYGRREEHVKKQLKELGDLGLVAKASRSSQKVMFKPQPLTIAKVLDTFRAIAKETGKDSQDKKRNHIKGLLVAATDCEPQYIIRLLQSKMRIGLAEKTVLVALGQAAMHSATLPAPPSQIQSPLEEETGKDSQDKKRNHIKGLLVAATDCEPQYIIRLLQVVKCKLEKFSF
ncbi:uncharacterized protein LOC109838972 [Asparagus officinalis]|uniref:uncharacterized protein LOC109838972 n=1 Tax=Asparagus officinalis TaxID=4686 RepID=UPI00098E6D7B|nr:uncharacterized protein LOC109838972 [Asparagus officinalis]